jgi:hypothetical protein
VSDYTTVKKAMEAGTPHEVICATCPWDRLCITPPSMSGADVEQALADAKQPRPEEAGGGLGRAIMTALIFAGKDTQAQLCPVFSVKLSSPDGRAIADGIRTTMRGAVSE